NEVREALAGTGAGLGEEMPALLEGLRDGIRELGLLLAGLVVVEHLCEGSAAAEDTSHSPELRRRDGRPTKSRSERLFPFRHHLTTRPSWSYCPPCQIRSAFGPAGSGVL